MEFDKMNDIKFGLKLWSLNYDLIAPAKEAISENIFQYIELMVVPQTRASLFKMIEVPFILHATSERWGFNISDSSKEIFNLDVIKNCLAWADELGARYVIVHPGFGEFAAAKNFLDKINDRRILIENMPKVGVKNEKMVGYDPEQIKDLKRGDFGFCLDLTHAVKAAASLKINYKKLIADFIELKPELFHISDADCKKEMDEHLDIGKGDSDFAFFADCIKKSGASHVTLETPRSDLRSVREDIDNLDKLRRSFL